MHPLLLPLLTDQAGVVSRRQALQAGLRPNDVRRLVRRRELATVHPGVFIDHTGEPSWIQWAWAAVLCCWPSALAGQSALRAVEGPGSRRRTTPVEVVVDAERHPVERHGVRVRRCRKVEERVLWQTGPPRLRYEEAVLDVAAAAASDLDCLGELSRAIQARRTTAGRLSVALSGRERLARSDWIASVLSDVSEGVCSVLEHGYLHRVERSHGLARARRQVRDRIGPGVVFRDVEYAGGLVVELDGRLFHDTTHQRDRDFDRDLESASSGKRSVRISYGQVFDRPCWTARHVARLLGRHGWGATPRKCGPTCSL